MSRPFADLATLLLHHALMQDGAASSLPDLSNLSNRLVESYRLVRWANPAATVLLFQGAAAELEQAEQHGMWFIFDFGYCAAGFADTPQGGLPIEAVFAATHLTALFLPPRGFHIQVELESRADLETVQAAVRRSTCDLAEQISFNSPAGRFKVLAVLDGKELDCYNLGDGEADSKQPAPPLPFQPTPWYVQPSAAYLDLYRDCYDQPLRSPYRVEVVTCASGLWLTALEGDNRIGEVQLEAAYGTLRLAVWGQPQLDNDASHEFNLFKGQALPAVTLASAYEEVARAD